VTRRIRAFSWRLNDSNCESGSGVYGVNGFAAQ